MTIFRTDAEREEWYTQKAMEANAQRIAAAFGCVEAAALRAEACMARLMAVSRLFVRVPTLDQILVSRWGLAVQRQQAAILRQLAWAGRAVLAAASGAVGDNDSRRTQRARRVLSGVATAKGGRMSGISEFRYRYGQIGRPECGELLEALVGRFGLADVVKMLGQNAGFQGATIKKNHGGGDHPAADRQDEYERVLEIAWKAIMAIDRRTERFMPTKRGA